jgi:ABC-type arginine/histidine transport system permease subunit
LAKYTEASAAQSSRTDRNEQGPYEEDLNDAMRKTLRCTTLALVVNLDAMRYAVEIFRGRYL